ncbi:SDR family NAD(P)-dependent oxidoreductase [Phycicoccus sp. Root101]|uniref:SDR family NAD(P)-dependent oxidoreductase n=1 Tax=Phycicoccus sp. Root101 TaxID=1736421 RepID=UPI0007035587|nr:SDR family NAD(P)-dependent oxidoreductase [Phycicoccus sp. Root101]KQU70275.1 dehydrogenase [Phycicoccus sp. Root101]
MPPNPAARALDWAMDKSLVLGYTRLGPRIRRSWWPADPRPACLAGRHVLVTGASGGLGLAAAQQLAGLGATAHLLGRNAERLESARAELVAAEPSARVEIAPCDLSDLDAVREFCVDFTKRVPELHALVHNAGVLPPERRTTAQGHELTLATHVLGPHLMTALLADSLRGGRVVVVSSGGAYGQKLAVDDLEYAEGDYSGVTAYARTKRMQLVITEQWADRLRGRVSVHSMHPGWADTPGVTESLPGFNKVMGPLLRSPAEGADTVTWLVATDDPIGTGGFWHDRSRRPTHYAPVGVETAPQRQRFWEFVVGATGENLA